MSSFQFPEINFSDSYNFKDKSYLWIWHANKIPPHIGISAKDHYFSLKVSGKDVGLPCSRTLSLAISKNISMVLVELKDNFKLEDFYIEFDRFETASPTLSTCLSPIKQLLATPKALQLSELLIELQKSKRIQQVFGINLPTGYNSLPEYSVEEIQNRLLLLSHAQGNTHLLKNS